MCLGGMGYVCKHLSRDKALPELVFERVDKSGLYVRAHVYVCVHVCVCVCARMCVCGCVCVWVGGCRS